jgi:aminopeptidase N
MLRKNFNFINPIEVIQVAKQAIRNYEYLFKQKYPFSKLDHVMCPEFKYGGMENVGCIEYSEVHLRQKVDKSLSDRCYFSIIISHEM